MIYARHQLQRYESTYRLHQSQAAKEKQMNVRIIGNDATGYRLVNEKNAVVGFGGLRSDCMLIASRNGWKIVR